MSDLTQLTEEEKAAYKSAFRDATYTHVDFKRDVLSVLTQQYGNAVKGGDKAIAIDANSSRRKADVIVAIQFRRYFKFRSSNDSEYVEGICFWNGKGERIANYPKQHSANLTTKHQNTSKWLKPMARVFKICCTVHPARPVIPIHRSYAGSMCLNNTTLRLQFSPLVRYTSSVVLSRTVCRDMIRW